MRRWMFALLLVCTMSLPCHHSVAGTTTVNIAVDTASALPSCLHYTVKGVCFWLQCSFPSGCKVKSSLRIEHFVPDAVVSVYHDSLYHPWSDYGAVISKASSGFGSALLGLPIDSAGTRTRDDRTSRNILFRDADAVGHPLGMLDFLLSGSWPSMTLPSAVAVPTPAEMMKFPSTIPGILSEWSSVPGTVSSTVVANVQGMVGLSNLVSQVSSGIGSIPGALSSAVSAGQSLSSVMSTGMNLSNLLGNASGSESGGLSGAALPTLTSVLSNMSFLGMGFFCPPASKPFELYFESHLDALTWRGVLPAEQLYAASWIPGIREIGSFPANTWSSVFPRDGSVIQQHTLKGAAVVAQRVGDIITRTAQPHIYTPLTVNSQANGYRYFHSIEVRENDPSNTIWQRLYPNPEHSCSAFGQNDTLSVTSWGDGNTSPEESAMWNMWRRYDCCQKVGQSFLFSIP